MPVFETDPLEQLAFGSEDADETVTLEGMTRDAALAHVETLIANAPAGRRYLLRFPPPAGDGRETLFQPLGRQLLAARREGRLSSCLPVRDGAGYIIVIGS